MVFKKSYTKKARNVYPSWWRKISGEDGNKYQKDSLSFMMNREQLCVAYGIECQEVTVFPWRWRTNMRCRRNQIGEGTVFNTWWWKPVTRYRRYQIPTGKAKSIIDNNEQFCSANHMSSLSLTMNNSSAMQKYFLASRHCLSLWRRTIMQCWRYHMLGSTVHK